MVYRLEGRCGQAGWKRLGWRCTASAATGSTWNQDFSKHTCYRTSNVRRDLAAQWYDGMKQRKAAEGNAFVQIGDADGFSDKSRT